MDNFRGFKKTSVPIKDINFFVGENSTGKSSVLGLITLLSSHRFWIEQSFDTEEVKFGHFNDIVSIHSADRSYFTIGFYGETFYPKHERFPKFHAHLLKYRDFEGTSELAEYFSLMEITKYTRYLITAYKKKISSINTKIFQTLIQN